MILHDFYIGASFDAYTFFGAHPAEKGFIFRVYAPAAEKVALFGDFNGWTEEEIDGVLRMEILDNTYFTERGITGNYHGGANIVFEELSILNWIVSHSK